MSENPLPISIRPETPADPPAIRDVIVQAFGQEVEANLVDLLRQQKAAVISLVAEVDGHIVGHILYSPVTIETNPRKRQIPGLAPLAVLPAWQRRGVGGALIRNSFEICCSLPVDGAVVLGSPEYYPRFGFFPAVKYGLRSEYPVPPEDFMVITFQPTGLEGCSGAVHYHPAFSWLDV